MSAGTGASCLDGLPRSREFVALAAFIIGLAVYYLRNGGPVLAIPALVGAVWLIGAAIAEIAERVKLGQVPFNHSFARAAALPRSS